ncbi:MAG: hypothetical protein INQ03_06660 [Candidatus Heimdallarchaeota archaeon]|nr:hypothetical protein [Candidatus Heimdallarchaeota archaeon]
MDLIDDLNAYRPLSRVDRPDVIEFESDSIAKNVFVVYSTDFNDTIPALLVQLWKFTGGFDHGMYNIVVNDLAVNTSVPVYRPERISAQITRITKYRPSTIDKTEKEQFIMNLYPDSTSPKKNEQYSLPYMCTVKTDSDEFDLNIPSWTPVQILPVERIKEGSIVEIWKIKDEMGIMKVLKL